MPEPILPAGTLSHTSHGDASTSSTPLELLRAVKEVQERRISVWHEYDDAFETFLRPSTAVHAAPINGSQNNVPAGRPRKLNANALNRPSEPLARSRICPFDPDLDTLKLSKHNRVTTHIFLSH